MPETVSPTRILDMASDHPYLSAASVVLGCAVLIRFARRQRSDLPPGPKGYPIVGNLFDLPPTHLWEKFSEFGKQYGPLSLLMPARFSLLHGRMLTNPFAGEITYLNVIGQKMIILNSSKAAVDLLDKRSSIYSNRPVVMMAGEIVGWNKILGFLQYGPRFREFRKYMNKSIGTRASVEKFAPLLEKETAKFVARVKADPSSLVQRIRK